MYSFPNFEPVHCSMSGSNCCVLSCIQASQEAGKVVWYSHLFKKFSQFVVIHKVKGFSIVSEANFFGISCFFYDLADVGNLISGSSAFSKSSLYNWKFLVHILLKPSLKDFEHNLASMWNECICSFPTILIQSLRICKKKKYIYQIIIPPPLHGYLYLFILPSGLCPHIGLHIIIIKMYSQFCILLFHIICLKHFPMQSS